MGHDMPYQYRDRYSSRRIIELVSRTKCGTDQEVSTFDSFLSGWVISSKIHSRRGPGGRAGEGGRK